VKRKQYNNKNSYDEAKQSLALDFNSHISLKTQLQDKLRSWLANKPEGFKIPSERKLASLLNVSIIIVKLAIMKLSSEGFFIRNVKGTFLAMPQKISSSEEHPLQKIAIGHFTHQSSRPTIKIAIFEIWQKQQAMWMKAAHLFNESNYNATAQIEFVPSTIADVYQYQSYLKEQKIDVALVAHNMIEPLKNSETIFKLPDDIIHRLFSEDYFVSLNKKDESTQITTIGFAAPICFSAWGILWNEELVGRELLFNAPTITSEDILGEILKTEKQIKDAFLLSNALCFFWSFGVPPLEESEDDFPLHHIQKLFHVAEKLAPCSRKVFWTIPYHSDGERIFLEGKAAFYAGNLYKTLQRMPEAKFKWRGVFISPTEGSYLNSGWNGLALTCKGVERKEAADFIRFMISAEGQGLITEFHTNLPSYLPSAYRITDFVKGSTIEQLQSSIKGYMFSDKAMRDDWYRILTQNLGLFLKEVVEGRMNAEEGAQEFFNTLNNKLSLKVITQ
jgi:DNA-binding transcriptional regulator YhcF (GntR family)